MGKITSHVEHGLNRASEIGRLVGEVALGGIVLMIVIDVILRYGFDRPLAFSIELVEVALLLVVFFGIAVCTAQRSHVLIEILVMRFPRRLQAITESLVHFLGATLFGIAAWRIFTYAILVKEMGNVTMMLRLPYYPFILIAGICSTLVSLLLWLHFAQFISKSIQR